MALSLPYEATMGNENARTRRWFLLR
jgi:hypothetical protein